jgi:hexosaminidase
MCWREEKYAVEAAEHGNDVIMAPTSHCYFDYYQGDAKTEPPAIGGFLPLETVYRFNPAFAGLTAQQKKHILGVQACLWTEYVPVPTHAEYMVYPRSCALAEVGWASLEKKNYSDFLARLNEHLKRLDLYGVNYRPLKNKM